MKVLTNNELRMVSGGGRKGAIIGGVIGTGVGVLASVPANWGINWVGSKMPDFLNKKKIVPSSPAEGTKAAVEGDGFMKKTGKHLFNFGREGVANGAYSITILGCAAAGAFIGDKYFA